MQHQLSTFVAVSLPGGDSFLQGQNKTLQAGLRACESEPDRDEEKKLAEADASIAALLTSTARSGAPQLQIRCTELLRNIEKVSTAAKAAVRDLIRAVAELGRRPSTLQNRIAAANDNCDYNMLIQLAKKGIDEQAELVAAQASVQAADRRLETLLAGVEEAAKVTEAQVKTLLVSTILPIPLDICSLPHFDLQPPIILLSQYFPLPLPLFSLPHPLPPLPPIPS